MSIFIKQITFYLTSFLTSSGPSSSRGQVGTDLMVKLIFGTEVGDQPAPHQCHCCVQTGYSVGNENILVRRICQRKCTRKKVCGNDAIRGRYEREKKGMY